MNIGRHLSAYGIKDPNKHSVASGLRCQDKSLTVQSQREDADINVIVRRFGVTGVLPQVMVPPTYGDFSGVSDYRTALHLIRAAEDSFMQLDADVRKRFGNDPAQFVQFCNDPANLPEMRKLGLAVPEPKAPEPVAVRVVPEPAKPAS